LNIARDDKAKSQLIHYAAAFDRFNFIEYLTQQGVNINTKNSEGSTALHIAARWGHATTAQWIMIREDCDIEAEDNEGNTALMWAVKWDHIQIVQLLINRGAVITKMDRSRNRFVEFSACRKFVSPIDISTAYYIGQHVLDFSTLLSYYCLLIRTWCMARMLRQALRYIYQRDGDIWTSLNCCYKLGLKFK
jgi:hypothetical protein